MSRGRGKRHELRATVLAAAAVLSLVWPGLVAGKTNALLGGSVVLFF